MGNENRGRTVVVKIGSSTLTSERGTFRLDPVAGLVAIIVVDLFKIIDVQYQQGKRVVGNCIFFNKLTDMPVKGFTIIDAGQSVCDRFLACFFQLHIQGIDPL